MPSPSPAVDAVSASESASLHGQKAKTPIIAGAVTGGILALAWLIGFIVYFYKRYRREKRARAAGFKSHREMLDPPKKQEAYIIPPDPAIVEGLVAPGEKLYNDPRLKKGHSSKHSKSISLDQREEEPSSPTTVLPHNISKPSRFPGLADPRLQRPSDQPP